VKKLAERIRRDQGHIDVLVNDIWGGELLKGGPQIGTSLYGSTNSTQVSGYFGSLLTLTSSPHTIFYRF
jgi:hypothetical protein